MVIDRSIGGAGGGNYYCCCSLSLVFSLLIDLLFSARSQRRRYYFFLLLFLLFFSRGDKYVTGNVTANSGTSIQRANQQKKSTPLLCFCIPHPLPLPLPSSSSVAGATFCILSVEATFLLIDSRQMQKQQQQRL